MKKTRSLKLRQRKFRFGTAYEVKPPNIAEGTLSNEFCAAEIIIRAFDPASD
jgi:hypothetical protein